MKNFILTLVLSAFMLIAPSASHAQYVGQPVRVLYSGNTVGTTFWVPIITQTQRAIKGVMISNTSSSTIQLGVAGGGSASNTEVAKVIIPSNQTSAVYYPVSFSGGYRISLLAYTSTVNGEGDFSFLY